MHQVEGLDKVESTSELSVISSFPISEVARNNSKTLGTSCAAARVPMFVVKALLSGSICMFCQFQHNWIRNHVVYIEDGSKIAFTTQLCLAEQDEDPCPHYSNCS